MSEQSQTAQEEARIRFKLEKRYQEWQGFAIHGVVYLLVNIILWLLWGALAFVPAVRDIAISLTGFTVVEDLSNIILPIVITLGWGVGLAAHYVHYYMEYGPGADRNEAHIQREIQRYRDQVASYEKPKNDHRTHLELTEDGEIEERTDNEAPRSTRRRS